MWYNVAPKDPNEMFWSTFPKIAISENTGPEEKSET